MVNTKDINAGVVGVLPAGDWSVTKEYGFLNEVQYDHDSWISLVAHNIGNVPADGSNKWKRSTNGGKYAYEQGEEARAKGDYAQTQALRAKAFSDNPPEIIDGWWYCWSESLGRKVPIVEATVDISSFTQEQIAVLLERAVRPYVSGTVLVFPAVTGVSISEHTLILNE